MTEPNPRRQAWAVLAYVLGLAAILVPLVWFIGRLATIPGAP